MALDITCLVGMLKVGSFPKPTLTTGGAPIEQYIADGSKDADGNPTINLSIDREAMIPLASAADPGVDSLLLHIKLAQLTQNPRRDVGDAGVSRIGLILADRFTPHRDVLG